MKQNSPKYYKVYTAADGRVCIASVEFAADFGANATDNCPCMGYIKVMHGNKRADAPCYLMPAKMAKLLKPEEYRPAPTGGSSPAAPKSRPDAATMALYWLLTEAAAFADAEPFRVFDNGQWHTIAKEAPDMLKRLKREFNITKTDLKTYPPTVAPAPVQDQQQPEPAAAPVEDIEAAVVAHFEDLTAHAPADDPAADILRAGIETGKVIICSVPKAEPTTPTSEKTEPTPAPVKKRKELAEYHGAIVEIIEHREGDAIIKYKYGAGGIANYEDLKPTTAKKTALPEWLQSFCILETESGIFRLDAVGQKNMHYYSPDGFCYSSSVARFIDSYGHTVKNWHIDPEFTPEENEPDPDAIGEIVTIPTEQKTAPTDAEVMETAARIRANYEAMQADIEAEREQAAAAFAEAITAYCEELSRPEPLAWEPETIIIPFEPRPAADVEQPRRRHRLNLRPRLSRWLHPARLVAVAFVVCLLSGLLLGMNTSTAADDIAAVYELHPVTVTAEAPDTFIEDEAPRLIEDKAPCLIEDKAPAPSPVKKLAAPSPVKNVADAAECSSQKTDTSDTLPGEKTAAPLAPAADADGLTICEGTPWAYTMMNWA